MKSARTFSLEDFQKAFISAPAEVRYLFAIQAMQEVYPQHAPMVGVTFYQETKQKFPEYFDKDRNPKLIYE
jgi:hypothetical protein